MQVRCGEGIAIHTGPEPCAGVREGVGEASAGVHIGQPLSRERALSQEQTRYTTRKAIRPGASSQAPARPGVVKDPGMYVNSSRGNREVSRLAKSGLTLLVRIGKARSRSR